MNTVRELHDRAMNLAQLALVARESGDQKKAAVLAKEACDLESKAAHMVSISKSTEPTRSILYRSAASLAYQAKRYDTALKLISEGLIGYPPPQIKEELEALRENVSFEQHRQEGCVTTLSKNLEISYKGEVVGSGDVKTTKQLVAEKTGLPEIVELPAGAPRAPLDEFLKRAEKAYLAYLEAQKEVLRAYRETQEKADEDYLRAEQKANSLRDEALTQSFMTWKQEEQAAKEAHSRALQEAEAEYLRAKAQAKTTYEEVVVRATTDYAQAIEQARQHRAQSLERAWKIFGG